ncbi:MAG: uridine diphosphate-N-acetylglucosamine-binding protein YvcK [Clostridia bacterium]|nr:uridine diphosphate-N-acetylglucosamine-binding protein YvcK [Clostridia bacterium]
MNDNLKEWMGSGLKMKRWLLLTLIGTGLIGYGFAKVMSSEVSDVKDIITAAALFIIGFACVTISFIMAERRVLQAIAESTTTSSKTVNLKKLLFDKRMLDKNIKIAVIGGGAGLANLLKGLKYFSNNITAIVSVASNGNNEETMTRDFGILPPGDLRQSLIALSSSEEKMKELMGYKFKKGSVAGQNFGNLLLAAMNDICDQNFAKAIQDTSEVLSVTGKVLPVTLDNVKLGAILRDGTRVIGENDIINKVIERNVAIEKVFLQPERCAPAPDVIRSIKEADLIVIGPGSLYTGIIPSLLIKEISDEVKKSKAIKMFVSNIMSERGQTDNYKVSDLINAIHEHIGKGVMQYCLANESNIMPEYIRRYNQEGADVLEVDKNEIKNTGVELIIEDYAQTDDKGYIRHDPNKLAKSIMKIVCDNMDIAADKKALEVYMIKSKLKNMNKKNKKKSILFRDVKVITNTKKTKKKSGYDNVPIVGQKK